MRGGIVRFVICQLKQLYQVDEPVYSGFLRFCDSVKNVTLLISILSFPLYFINSSILGVFVFIFFIRLYLFHSFTRFIFRLLKPLGDVIIIIIIYNIIGKFVAGFLYL